VHDIQAIHRVYGDIVRVAPNEISIARSEGWNDIYCRRPGHQPFPKNPIWWGDVPGRTPSIVSTPNLADHRRMRTLLSTCFTPSALQAQEPAVISYVDEMMAQLRRRCGKQDHHTAIINIVDWIQFVTFDIIGDLAFGETFQCLDNNALHPWVAELFTYSRVGAAVAALRHYTIIFSLIMRCLPAKILKASQDNYQWGVEKTHRRLNLEVQREDFISRIVQYSDNEDLQMSLPELENNMNLLIFAGSDTCATVLSGTINYLVKTPHAWKSLIHEIRSSYRDASEITFSSSKKLPYLVATVEEGLRLCPPNPSGLQHIVPSGGDTVCGHWLPGGVCSRSFWRRGCLSRYSTRLMHIPLHQTHVSVHQQSLYRSNKRFYQPDTFWPERWLPIAKADPMSRFHNDDINAVQSFGTGSWSCIGKDLAYGELRVTLAKLCWCFDLSAAVGGRNVDWLMQKTYAMVERQPFDVQLSYAGGKLV